MNRILCIVGSMDMGGAETFLMKIYRCLNKKEYQMDFCVSKKKEGVYDNEIISLGGKIYHITPKTKNPFKNFNAIKRIVEKNNYKVVFRISQHSLSALELFAAKLGGAKKLIYRSSNSNSGGGKLNLLAHYIFRPVANRISNVKIAPSKEAAIFMFGKRYVKLNRVLILNNGLDYNMFKFNEEFRKSIRKELNIKPATTVIGHVGRFNFQKNHKFLIDIFEKYQKINNDSVLLLVGIGELENEIKKYVNIKNITSKVIFLGLRKDTYKIYSALDYFIFPSLFEGMPNTVIEAQANGLPCIISDTISKDVKILNSLRFISLDKSPDFWANNIEKTCREKNVKNIIEKDYDIKKITEKFISHLDLESLNSEN